MKRSRWSAVAVSLILLAGSARAHHSVSATFDLSRTITITGTLVKLDWRNPHMEFMVDAKADTSPMKVWVIQGASINTLRNQNITKADFERAIGQTLTVQAHPAKEGSKYGAVAVKITFPDGRSSQLAID